MLLQKFVELGLMKTPPRTVKEKVAEGFAERQRLRDQRRAEQNVKNRAYLKQRRDAQARALKVRGRI